MTAAATHIPKSRLLPAPRCVSSGRRSPRRPPASDTPRSNGAATCCTSAAKFPASPEPPSGYEGNLSIQAIIQKPALEAIHPPALRGLAGLDVYPLDSPFYAPGQEVPVAEFGPIVSSPTLVPSALGH